MRNLKFLAAACLLSISASSLVGCKESEPTVETPAITFPDSKDIIGVVGEEYSLSFDAVAVWNLNTNVSWIEFKEGDELFSSLTGKAGEQEVTFVVNDNEIDFVGAEGEITLKIGTEEQVVATIAREGKESTITFYDLDITTGESTEHPEGEPFVIDWANNANAYSRKISFVTNFNWSMEGLPEWISSPSNDPIPTKGEAGVEFSRFFATDYNFYTMDESMEATLTIVNDSNPEDKYTFTISTDGAKEFFKVISSNGYQGFAFEADGTYADQLDGTSFSSYDFSFVTEADKMYTPVVIECEADGNGGYWFGEVDDMGQVSYPHAYDWVYIGYSDDVINTTYESGALGLYNSVVEVIANEGDARSAGVFAFPTSIEGDLSTPADFATLFDDSGLIKAEYEKYFVGYVTQEGSSAGLEFLYADYVSSEVASLTAMDPSNEYYEYYMSEYGVSGSGIYILEYAEAGAGGGMAMIELPYVFDFEAGDDISVPSAYTSWLTAELAENYFIISMNSTTAKSDGVVILKQGYLNKFVIQCIQKRGSAE